MHVLGRATLKSLHDLIPALLEAAANIIDVILAARLELELDVSGAKGLPGGERAVVVHLEDVGAKLSDQSEHGSERAGCVGDDDLDAPEAAGGHQAALDDARDDVDVDVTTTNDGADALAAKARNASLGDGGDGGGASALGHCFFLLEQGEDRVGDLFFRDGDDIIDVVRDVGERQVADLSHGDAVGECCRLGHFDERVLFDGGLHRGQDLGLDANDLDLGVGLLDGASDPGDQPAAADGDDDRVEVGVLLEQLEADGALTRDHGAIVEGVREDAVFFLFDLTRLAVGGVIVTAVEDDLCAELARAGDLDQRGSFGHDDLGRHPQPGPVVGDGLCVVSCARGDDASASLLGRQGHQLVAGAALLEGAGDVMILELEVDLAAGLFAQQLAVEARGHA